MDIKKLTQEVLLKNMTPEQQMAVLDSVQASVKEAKAVQKQKIAENVDLVLQALKRIEADMIKRVDGSAQIVEDRVKTIKDGKDGKNGIDGKAGRDGKDGKNGSDGRNGKDGLNGVSGERGQDGVGVQNAHIDFDGSLIIALTDGRELNVGEVVPFDVAEKIRVIGNGGGTSQFVIDTLASLQTQIDNFQALPSQTGNAGKFLTTDGTNPSWASVAGGLSYQGTWNASTNSPTLASSAGTNGYYYIVGTAGSTNLNGITDWQVGDWLLFNGSTWQKLDQTNLVTSVAGRIGAVTIGYTDLTGTTPTWNQNTTGTAANVTGTVAVANGGTGSTTASGARTNLGLGTIATQDANSVAITGGTIDGTTIGGTTPAVITGSTVNANTKVVSPDFYAQSVIGGNLRTYTGTSLLNWDGGGSGNVTVNGGLTATPANKNVNLSPTGTGTVTINPATASAMDNVAIGGTTAAAATFTTLTATGQTSLGGAAGSEGLRVTTTSGAVNYWSIQGNTAGNAPLLRVLGTDTNVAARYRTQASGSHVFETQTFGNQQMVVSHTASAVNYVQVTGAATSAIPVISAQGSDANIPITLRSKGVYNVNLQNGNGNNGLIIDMTAGSTLANYVSIAPKTAGIAPVISVLGTDTNIDLNLTPKGTGVLKTTAVANIGAGTVLAGATNPLVAMTGNTNQYVQSYIVNNNAGTSASSDFVAYANNSTDAHGWADMGFTSSVYADATYTVTGPNEAYLFGSALNSSYTGNLVYATDSTGSANVHQFYVGGFTQAKSAWKAQIDTTGLKATQVNSTNGIIFNSQTVSSNVTVASGDNGGSFGPVTVASGVTVTISSGSVWTIV